MWSAHIDNTIFFARKKIECKFQDVLDFFTILRYIACKKHMNFHIIIIYYALNEKKNVAIRV